MIAAWGLDRGSAGIFDHPGLSRAFVRRISQTDSSIPVSESQVIDRAGLERPFGGLVDDLGGLAQDFGPGVVVGAKANEVTFVAGISRVVGDMQKYAQVADTACAFTRLDHAIETKFKIALQCRAKDRRYAFIAFEDKTVAPTGQGARLGVPRQAVERGETFRQVRVGGRRRPPARDHEKDAGAEKH